MYQQPQTPERRVVGRDERSGCEEQSVRTTNFDAPHRHSPTVPNRDDRAPPLEPSARFLELELPRQPEHRPIGVKVTSYFGPWSTPLSIAGFTAMTGRNPRLATSSWTWAASRPNRRELAPSPLVAVAIGVHQTLEQGLPLRDIRAHVVAGDVLVAQEVHRPQRARQGIVAVVPPGEGVACVARATDAMGERTARRSHRAPANSISSRIAASAVVISDFVDAVTDPRSEHVGVDHERSRRILHRGHLGRGGCTRAGRSAVSPRSARSYGCSPTDGVPRISCE